MSTRKETIKESRREFLRTLAIGGGAATVMAVAGGVAVAETEPEQQGTDAPRATVSQGYHVTPHIKDYYRKASL